MLPSPITLRSVVTQTVLNVTVILQSMKDNLSSSNEGKNKDTVYSDDGYM